MDNFLTHEALTENLNTSFHVYADDTNIADLELAEVSELKLFATQEQFAVIFRGPREPFLSQGMRSLDHEKLGRSELFLVPIRDDAEGYYYEAVFNRFRK
jgi:Domain of unknown function (DUF6916)